MPQPRALHRYQELAGEARFQAARDVGVEPAQRLYRLDERSARGLGEAVGEDSHGVVLLCFFTHCARVQLQCTRPFGWLEHIREFREVVSGIRRAATARASSWPW